MLAEEEPDDDTHLCLKCNTTIIGLENYIEHRKSFCPTTKLINKPRTTTTDPLRMPTTTPATAAVSSSATRTTTVSSSQAGIKRVSGGAAAASSSASTGITNKDQSKLKASYDRDDDRKSHSAHGYAMADTSFGDEEDQNYDSFSSAASKSNKALDKSLDSYHLDYDLMDGDDAAASHRNSAGDSTTRARAGADKLPSEGVDYNYEGADLFFSSLELQSSSKRNLNRKSEDRSHGQRLKLMSTRSVVRGKLASPMYHHEDNLNPILTLSSEESDDDDDDVVINFEFAYEEEQYDVDGLDAFEDQFSAPPRTHTGGKWKPEYRPNTTAMRTSSPKYRTTSETYEHPSWTLKHPPTGTTTPSAEEEDYPVSMSPPQDYTRGKWIPGSKVMKGTALSMHTSAIVSGTSISGPTSPLSVAHHHHTTAKSGDTAGGGVEWFWCSVCNRKLTSRVLYQRHLQSNLHMKRALLESELEEPSTSTAAAVSPRHSLLEGPEKTLLGKRQRRPIHLSSQPQLYSIKVAAAPNRQSSGSLISQQQMIRESPATPTKIAAQSREVDDESREIVVDSCGEYLADDLGRSGADLKAPKRKIKMRKKQKVPWIRRKIYTTCDVCKIKLPKSYLGKHLISHCHYRRMQLNPSEGARLMVLQNLDPIIRQSPFQCQPCRFYAVSEELFMLHWRSEEHQEQMHRGAVELMWCSFCKFECPVELMEEHLTGETHQEVIQAFNRCVPIIIRQKTPLKCLDCGKGFRFNLALRKHHCKGREGISAASIAFNAYQSIYCCPHCPMEFRSNLRLKNHRRIVHDELNFFCSVCQLTFPTKESAVKHRATVEHKVASSSNKEQKKTCKSCNEEFANILKLKQHLRDKHPDQRFSCLLCGEQFVLVQELTCHIRDRKCGAGRGFPKKVVDDNALTCAECDFQTESEAELIFHGVVLHGNEPVGTGRVKIPCPECEKPFSKASLLCHLRKHTNERIFQCSHCGNGYMRKYNLVDHMKYCSARERQTGTEDDEAQDVGATMAKGKGSASSNRDVLLKCSFKDCPYKTINKRNLDKHKEIHLPKDFKCPQCEYETTTARYLKRHSLLHMKSC